jgi:SAM-dependent methyltransferase
MISSLRSFLGTFASQAWIWPKIDDELQEAGELGLLKGRVLNAGAGWRDLSHLIKGELVNQDLAYPGDTRTNIQVYSPLHQIPEPEGAFDTIICIAVLEHVENPEEVVPEFFRVLKPGGSVVVSVPFMQPEHKVPTDFQRYTKDGLERLFAHHGFEVLSCKPLFSAYHTLHWIVFEFVRLKQTLMFKMLRYTMVPVLGWLARNSELQSEKLASVFQLIARKPTLV